MANVINTHYYVKVLQMQAILMEGRIKWDCKFAQL